MLRNGIYSFCPSTVFIFDDDDDEQETETTDEPTTTTETDSHHRGAPGVRGVLRRFVFAPNGGFRQTGRTDEDV